MIFVPATQEHVNYTIVSVRAGIIYLKAPELFVFLHTLKSINEFSQF